MNKTTMKIPEQVISVSTMALCWTSNCSLSYILRHRPEDMTADDWRRVRDVLDALHNVFSSIDHSMVQALPTAEDIAKVRHFAELMVSRLEAKEHEAYRRTFVLPAVIKLALAEYAADAWQEDKARNAMGVIRDVLDSIHGDVYAQIVACNDADGNGGWNYVNWIHSVVIWYRGQLLKDGQFELAKHLNSGFALVAAMYQELHGELYEDDEE